MTEEKSFETASEQEVLVAEGVTADDVGDDTEAPQGTSSDAAKQLSEDEQVALLEALLLAHGEPIGLSKLQDVFHCTKAELLTIVERLEKHYSDKMRGIEVVVVAERLQLRTKAAYAEFVRALMAVKPRRLSQAALETLSVIAYRQPVVKSEIDKIRGVDVAPTIKTLIDRKLIKIIGYQASVGQPALYGTTDEFLQVFGLAGLSDLPALRDIKSLAKEPGEADDSGPSNPDKTGAHADSVTDATSVANEDAASTAA